MRKSILKYETIHVISFMLKATRKRASAYYLDVGAVLILASTDSEVRTCSWSERARKRKATLV